jgi:glycosyltransferase involved in cell wall biosynthesis
LQENHFVVKKENLPKISIVTPSFNQAEFLEETIKSVLNQEYPNLEYIIIDGGSTDGSIDIIKKYEEKLHYWCSEPDNGQYDAINKGFAESTGEIMGWINCDDIYFSWTFKTVGKIMKSFIDVEWITSLKPGLIDSHGYFLGFYPIPGYSKQAFMDSRYCYDPQIPFLGWIQQESTFWRRTLWQKIGSALNLNFKYAGDFDLWCKFYQLAELYGATSPLACFRRHNAQISSGYKDEYEKEARQLLQNTRSRCNWNPKTVLKLLSRLNLIYILKYKFLRSLLFNYTGKKIINISNNKPNEQPVIESYKFS